MHITKKLGLWAARWFLGSVFVATLAACGVGAEREPVPAAPNVITNPVVTPTVANQPPVGSFIATPNGLTVTFSASDSRDPDGTILGYQWNFGDGTAVLNTTSANVTHVFANSGTFMVNLIVLDSQGTVSTVVSQNISIEPIAAGNRAPTALFTLVTGTNSVAVNATGSFDPDGNITNYAWNFGELNASTNTANGSITTHVYAATGSFVVTLTVTDDRGLTAVSTQTISIGGNNPPIPKFTPAPNALLVSFDASASTDTGGTITSYAWNFGESNSTSNTATGVTTIHRYRFAGLYIVTLVVTDDKGATATIAQSLRVNPPAAVATGVLNDTSITASQCYQAGSDALISCTSTAAIALSPDQDGMVGRDAFANTDVDGALGFSFTKIGASGEVLPANAAKWSCVKDNVTGLMWEIKNQNSGDLNNINSTFTNYDSTQTAQLASGGLPTQAEIDAPTNSIGFKNAVNAAGLCGATDWRIPEPLELQSYVNYGNVNPVNTPEAFGLDNNITINNGSISYISSSPQNASPTFYWSFRSGFDSLVNRTTPAALRLVRGLPANPALKRFELRFNAQTNLPDVVYDTKTNLEWRRCVEGMTLTTLQSGVFSCTGTPAPLTQEAALVRATQARGDGWRLPNVKEGFSLIDRNAADSLIDSAAFPNTPTGSNFFAVNFQWTSSPAIINTYVFSAGSASTTNRSAGATVRLVRTPSLP
jgi:PKD repeat protein